MENSSAITSGLSLTPRIMGVWLTVIAPAFCNNLNAFRAGSVSSPGVIEVVHYKYSAAWQTVFFEQFEE